LQNSQQTSSSKPLYSAVVQWADLSDGEDEAECVESERFAAFVRMQKILVSAFAAKAASVLSAAFYARVKLDEKLAAKEKEEAVASFVDMALISSTLSLVEDAKLRILNSTNQEKDPLDLEFLGQCEDVLKSQMTPGVISGCKVEFPFKFEGKLITLPGTLQSAVHYMSNLKTNGGFIPQCRQGASIGGLCSTPGCKLFHQTRSIVHVDCRSQVLLPSKVIAKCVCGEAGCVYENLDIAGPFFWKNGTKIPLMVEASTHDGKTRAFGLTHGDVDFIMKNVEGGGCGFFLGCHQSFRTNGSSIIMEHDGLNCCMKFMQQFRTERNSRIPSVIAIPDREKKRPVDKVPAAPHTRAPAAPAAPAALAAPHTRAPAAPAASHTRAPARHPRAHAQHPRAANQR
jgi:hypothetical protein